MSSAEMNVHNAVASCSRLLPRLPKVVRAAYHPLRTIVNLPPSFGRNQLQLSDSEAAQARLEKIAREFKAPIRYAIAYGSGVMKQKGYTEDAPKPLLDILIATSHTSHFHSINVAQNPSHYPFYARWLGSDAVAWIQDRLGAGVWYVADVEMGGERIKYGIISLDTLCSDLLDWNTLYVSGRMHKPVHIFRSHPRVLLAAQANLFSALRYSLLSLPTHFTADELYEQIAKISYTGDPRMSVPGAENPQKVKNIVAGQRERFQRLYAELVEGLGVKAVDGGYEQPDTTQHRAALLGKLPRNLRLGIQTKYAQEYRVTVITQADAAKYHREATVSGKLIQSRKDGEIAEDVFWQRVAAEMALKPTLDKELRSIVARPALTQSIKGLFTAGLGKSFRYSFAKVAKWMQGRKT